MRLFFWALLATSLPWMIMASGIEPAFFSYRYTIDDLPNGLRLITVPTDMPRIVALYTVVQAGSRDEVEPGKSGFAHLFEHMMFRGSKNFTPEQRDAILKRAGASANAYTSDDLTVYHEVFSADDLEQVMKLEADRFQRLQYGRDAFKTETRAVLGEYNKSSADPQTKMYELLRATAFTTHTYRHTTMGFLADIENMPNEYDYSLQFYQRYYRPEYTTIVLVGDLTRERALSLTEKFFGDWKRGDYAPHIPVEPPQTEPRSAHIDWPTPTLPQLYVAFHGPAYSDEKIGKAALDLLAPIAFGENSDLYRRLVFKEQKVDRLEVEFDNLADPELFSVYARVKSPGDLQEVQDQILATFKRFSNETIPQAVLDATRSRLRYGTALALNSSEAIASFLAPYVALRRSPATIDKLFALYDQVSPSDVRDVAARYFVESNRVIVTLASKVATPKSIAAVLQPGQSPLVSFRILFQTGSAADPPGQEGVAALTAALLAQGGTRTLPYDQIVDAMYPMATTFNWQVDKEMTVFYGTTHRDNLERYYELIRSMLLEPGFRSDDFARLKAEAINFLKITLRNSNDEELAKEQLYNLLYAGTPYGHHNRGRISSLEKITLDDVRAFYRSHYNQANLVLGLAGGYPDGFPQRVAADFVRLP
ncbi:MAG: insulinase family protein, partial [Candidatus Omnitrophica bacterium]|nr:insulinase family protein [Candidatus Omnitrophota bacterium]